MTYDDFIQSVKQRARFRSDDQIKKAADAVLEVLGRRITSGQAEDIAAALPPELRPFLRQTPEAESFDLNQFLTTVGEKEGVSPATAEEHCRAVLSVLADWIPKPELRDTLEQLPNEMRNLFVWMKKAA